MRSRARSEGRRGVTIIELLIVAAITVMLGILASPLYGNFYTDTQLDEAHQNVKETLRLARGRARAGLHNTSHGIHIGSASEYTLYQGTSYALRDTLYDRTHTVGSAIEITTTLPGGDVVFGRDGLPSGTGSITLRRQSGEVRTLTINSHGIADE